MEKIFQEQYNYYACVAMQQGKLFARLRISYLPAGCITGQLRFTGYASGHPVMQPDGRLRNRRPVMQPGKLRIRAEHIYTEEDILRLEPLRPQQIKRKYLGGLSLFYYSLDTVFSSYGVSVSLN